MKLFIFTTTLIVSVCFEVSAFAAEYKFADIGWHSTKDSAKDILAKKGYTSTDDKDGDLEFIGELMGQKIRGCCLYNPQGQLMKVIVSFLTPDTTCLDFHKHVKDQLITKYGKPHKDYELYQSPYTKGDGFAEQAIKMNKYKIAAFWISDEGNCSLEVTKKLAVNISYEAKDWGTEAERRQSESAKDL